MAEVSKSRWWPERRRCSRGAATRFSAIPVLAACLVIGSPAQAEEKAAPTVRDGVLVLPNVRIQAATPEMVKRVTRGSADQGRAYKDQDTGQLRMPTPEELVQASLEPEPASAPVEVRTLPDGTRVAALGAEAMAHSVVHRKADGTLQEDCVTGSTAAAKAMATPVTQERRDDDR